MSQQFPDYWHRYSEESDAVDQIMYNYDYIDYPFDIYFDDEINPKEEVWIQVYYDQLSPEQKKIVHNLRNQY